MTPKQEAFAIAVSSGMTQADAYRSVYNVRANTKQESIHQAASTVMANINVSSRVDELKQQLADKELWTREDSIRAMIQVIEEPDNQGCKINAVKVINDMQGFNAATKTQVSGTITHENALDMLR
jgi:hypothetical protein